MSDKKNVFGLREYSRQDLFVDATDEVRDADRFYIMVEADAVIAELKEENSEIQKQTDIAWGKVNAMYDEITALKAEKERLEKELNKCQDIAQQCFKREVKSRERIDELDAKNQRLSKALEDERQFGLSIARKADHTIARDNEKLCEKEKELRAARRVLLLVCAKRADAEACAEHRLADLLLKNQTWSAVKYHRGERDKWYRRAVSCRAKAEEYK